MSIHRRPDGSQVNVGLLRHALLGGTAIVSTLAFSADFTVLTSLPSWLSFARASNAMVTDSTGNLTYAPNNLITQSNNFSDAAWGKDQTGSITATGVADPFGGTSASTFTAGASGGRLYQFDVLSNSFVTRISTFWLRRRTGTGTINMSDPSGAIIDVTSQVSGTWARVSVVAGGGGASNLFYVQLTVSGDQVDVCQAQVEAVTYETSPRPYNDTTSSPYYGPRFDHAWNGSAWVATGLSIEEQRTSLLHPSTGLGASWSGNNVISTDAAALAPDGTTTATKVRPTGTSNPVLYNSAAQNGLTTCSVFAKAAEYTKASLRIDYAGGGPKVAIFNLSTGSLISAEAGMTASIQDCGGGEYRLIGTIDAGVSANTVYHQFGPVDDGYSVSGGNITLGSFDSTKGVYFWGAQMEPGSFATSYIPTTSAAVTRSADMFSLAGAADTAARLPSASIIMEVGELPSTIPGNSIFIADAAHFALYRDASTNKLQTITFRDGSAGIIGPVLTWPSINRFGIAYGPAGASQTANGGAIVTGTGTEDWGGGTIALGDYPGGGSEINGHLRSIAIYSSRLSDADLQAKSVVGAAF